MRRYPVWDTCRTLNSTLSGVLQHEGGSIGLCWGAARSPVTGTLRHVGMEPVHDGCGVFDSRGPGVTSPLADPISGDAKIGKRPFGSKEADSAPRLTGTVTVTQLGGAVDWGRPETQESTSGVRLDKRRREKVRVARWRPSGHVMKMLEVSSRSTSSLLSLLVSAPALFVWGPYSMRDPVSA